MHCMRFANASKRSTALFLPASPSEDPERIINRLARRYSAIVCVDQAAKAARLADHRILSEAAPPLLGRDVGRRTQKEARGLRHVARSLAPHNARVEAFTNDFLSLYHTQHGSQRAQFRRRSEPASS